MSTIQWPFNIHAVETRRLEEKDSEKRNSIKRVNGKHRVRLFRVYVNKHLKAIRRARRKFSKEDQQAIYNSIADKSNNQSAKEREHQEDDFAKAVKKLIWMYKPEEVSAYKVTALMGGTVILSGLTLKGGHD